MLEHLGRHAGCGPGCDVAWRHQAGIGKTGFLGSGPASLQHGDFVPVTGQLVGRGDADDAGANDCNLHLRSNCSI